MKDATLKLCEVIHGTGFGNLDAATIRTVRHLIKDGIAAAMAGTREPAPTVFANYVKQSGVKPESSVWGFGFKASAVQAAFANGLSMHILDFEAMSSPPAHACSPTVPTAVALAEAREMDGRELITACAKGFEMQGRILMAANPGRDDGLFHTPGVVGPLGSAVVASHLLKLNATQLAHAIAIAGSRCAGLSGNTGSMVKSSHCGNAAAAGLEAALLASHGFLGNTNIIEGEEGYVETFYPNHFDYEALLAYGQGFRCVDPGMAIKFYPCKYPTQFAITAALEARKSLGDTTAGDIAEILIDTPDIHDADRPLPRSGLEGKFSFQYTAAAALLDGRVGISTFTDQRYTDDIRNLLGKTKVERDPSRSKDTANMWIKVTVKTRDGKLHEGLCTKPPGTWGVPLDEALHANKVRDCLAVRFNDKEAAELTGLLDTLDAQPASGVRRLVELLRRSDA